MGAVAPQKRRSIASLLSAAARLHPDRPAVALGPDELSYRELTTAVDRLASRMLEAAGGSKAAPDLQGSRVCLIAPNVPALVVGLFATWSLGAVAVPLSARLREHELSGILENAEPILVLSVGAHLGYSFVDLLARLLPRLESVRVCLFLGKDAEVEDEVSGPAAVTGEPLEPAIGAILYTSGTTGASKGALLTHRREIEGAPLLASILSLTPADEVAFPVPISHAFGLTCLLSTFCAGACASLIESTFSSRPLVEALERRRATVLHGSPSLFRSLLKARAAGVPSIRTGFMAGAPPPPDLIERLERSGSTILNLYGLTETSVVSCCRPGDSPPERYTTAGRALPGFELRIAGRSPSGSSSPGELQLKGPFVTPGYHRRPAETEEAFEDGWFRTGDLAVLEDDFIRIVGRKKEIFNIGGFNVSPAEVEAVFLDHPDVEHAVVVGAQDNAMGEVLHAFVVPAPGSALTPAILLQHARRNVAGYKLPYAIRIVDELPLLASGKPDRLALTQSVRGCGINRLEA